MAKLPGETKEYVLKVEIVDMETGNIVRRQERIKKEPDRVLHRLCCMADEGVQELLKPVPREPRPNVSRETPKAGEL